MVRYQHILVVHDEHGMVSCSSGRRERAFKKDEQFVITCFGRHRREMDVEVSLDADWDDPVWTVQLRLRVAEAEWAEMADRLRRYFAGGREARMA